MMAAHITRLATFAQHGQPAGYAASDMMRADLEALIMSATKPSAPADRKLELLQQAHDRSHAEVLRLAERLKKYEPGSVMHLNAAKTPADRDVMREAFNLFGSIAEYWNGDRNDDAMLDALQHAEDVAVRGAKLCTTPMGIGEGLVLRDDLTPTPPAELLADDELSPTYKTFDELIAALDSEDAPPADQQGVAEVMQLAEDYADCDESGLDNKRRALRREKLEQALTAIVQERDRLLSIIANTYQILGALDAPTHTLDVLSDPLGVTDTEIEAMLPFVLCGRIHTHPLKE